MSRSTAPERISIKRRRTDEPVDHLLYQSKKQRTTDHIFVRLRYDGKPSTQQNASIANHPSASSAQQNTGIPTVKATQEGDEIKDFQRYKSSQMPQADRLTPSLASDQTPGKVRQFHLTRDLSTALRPAHAAGIRKNKSNIRPHLPTFIERFHASDIANEDIYVTQPVDRMVKSADINAQETGANQALPAEREFEKYDIAPFRQPRSDADDDNLADELAALAMELDDELDPEIKAEFLKETQSQSQKRQAPISDTKMVLDQMDEYVYETYIRIKQDSLGDLSLDAQHRSFGYLVIDEDEEDLWQQYLNDEDEDSDEWNEEDEDSNAEDNPRNDYPDEEVSSDDEFGANAYKYRRYCSDDEQFGEDDE